MQSYMHKVVQRAHDIEIAKTALKVSRNHTNFVEKTHAQNLLLTLAEKLKFWTSKKGG